MAMCQTYKMQGVYRQLREQVFLSTEEHLLKILEDLEASGALSGEYGLKRVSHQLLADMAGAGVQPDRPSGGPVFALPDSAGNAPSGRTGGEKRWMTGSLLI